MTTAMLTSQDRHERLENVIASTIGPVWRLDQMSDYSATFIHGKPVNHILHLLLTLITFGMWLPVWLLLGIFGGEKHFRVTVQPDGTVDSSNNHPKHPSAAFTGFATEQPTDPRFDDAAIVSWIRER